MINKHLDYNDSKNLTFNIIKEVFAGIWTEEESLFFSRYIEKVSNKIFDIFKNKIIGLERGDFKLCLYNALLKGRECYKTIKYVKAYISTIFKNNCLSSIKKDINNYNSYNNLLKTYKDKLSIIEDISEDKMLNISYARQLLESQSHTNNKILKRVACGYSWTQISELDNINIWKIRKCMKNVSNYDKA